jgi:major vault protein
VSENKIIALNSNQYCYVESPVDKKTGKPMYGLKELRKGEQKFFLLPGEVFLGVEPIMILQEDEALLLKAKNDFKDSKTGDLRKAGTTWMINGPIDYIPEIEVIV